MVDCVMSIDYSDVKSYYSLFILLYFKQEIETCFSFIRKKEGFMSQGLRPHFHQEYIGRSEQYYNKKKHLLIKKEQKICMICGRERYVITKCYVPPPNRKENSNG
jgi:hypothetical protein